MKEALLKLKSKESLTPSEMARAMETIVTGKCPDVEIETFLLLLREKGETATEIAAAAKVMRKHSIKLSKTFPDLLDTCGTGGDAQHTVNVSTLSAIVAASAGVQVGKHGNRSVSSVCGSADLLEMLGVKIDLPVASIENGIDQMGFGFFFAPQFHPATRFAMPARKKIQGKTLFNVLGPLSNPAGALHQLIGVYNEKLVRILAEALLELGAARALVVHGLDGLDEITTCDKTFVAEVTKGVVKTYTIAPEDFGLPRAVPSSLKCASKEACRDMALRVLGGENGPPKDIVSLNSGAALYLAGKVKSIKEGVGLAQEMMENGEALEKLEEIVAFTQKK